MQRGQVSAGCLVKSPDLNATPEEVKSCIQDDQLLLACGKKVPLLSNACVEPLTGVRSKMRVVKGKVGEKTVDVLRWLGWIVLGGYLPSLSINYVGMSKDMEKNLPQLYYKKMKISYDLGFIAIGVVMAT